MLNILFILEMSSRRRESPKKLWVSDNICYYLFYISEEKKYISFNDNSGLLPKGLNKHNLMKGQEVEFSKNGNDFVAKFVTLSSNEKELKEKERILNEQLDMVGDDSLNISDLS